MENKNEDLIEQLCEEMHDRYEAAAIGAGWETNPESRLSWADIPEANKQTMRAAVGPIADRIIDLEALLYAGRMEVSELEAKANHTCKWQRQLLGTYGDYDSWTTQCGEDFAIEEEWHDTPTKFCANCGGKTVEVSDE